MNRRLFLGGLTTSLIRRAASPAIAAPPTRVVILGSKGGPRVTPQFGRSPTAHLVVADDVPYVVDCGNGVTERLVRAGIDLTALRHVFLTHHHIDHILEYGGLLMNAWAAGLRSRVDSWGPPPLVEMTRLIFETFATDIDVRMHEEGRPDPRRLVVAHEFTEPGPVFQDDRVRVTMARGSHGEMVNAYGYRFDMADRSVVFSGDTQRSDAITHLATGADVLIHEAMYLPALDRLLAKNPNAPTLRAHLLASHTPAEDCGRVAEEAGVRTLVLSHLVPGDDPDVTDEMWIAEAATQFSGRIVVARDGMEV